MNQKIIIVDDFYDIAHQYHKSFFENQCMITEETVNKLSHILQRNVNVINATNEVLDENSKNHITANTVYDWIAVIYLTLPGDCVSTQGMSFFIHKKTQLDSFPNDYAKSLYGLQTDEDIANTFDIFNFEDWKEYMNVFVKYNRLVLFCADYWHSYGGQINNSIIYQKILLENV